MSEPEPHLNGRVLPVTRGRVLGGSSSINGMFFMRGHSSDFDGWQALGCEGWGYAHVLPYFKKLESSWRGAVPYHGACGPMPIAPNATTRLLHEPLMHTAAPAGYWTSDDMHGRARRRFRARRTHGGRARTARERRARLPAAGVASPESRGHAGRADHARAGRKRQRAVGVELRRGNETRKVFAEREVILCGGTYNSAQLLMLSGFGAADELRAHRHSRARRPAGRRCESLRARARRACSSRRASRFPSCANCAPIASPFRCCAGCCSAPARSRRQVSSCNVVIRTDAALAQPDIQLMCNPMRMDAKIWWPLLSRRQAHLLTADAVLLHPQSRGRVSLRSADPCAKPRIQFNCPGRARRPRHAAARVCAPRATSTRTPPQADLIEREVVPGAQVQSDADLDALHPRECRRHAASRSAPVRWRPGPGRVVDAQLRVQGVDGLRVADASIMPTVPGGNTYGAVLMIAERAADLIRGRTLPPQLERS